MSLYLYGVTHWPVEPGADEPKARGAKSARGKKNPSKTAAKAGRKAGRGAEARINFGPGVGDPQRTVEFVRHRDLAALVSDVAPAAIGSGQGVRGLRRDMKAHANVLNSAAALGVTVLPVQFGVILPDPDALVGRLLEPQQRAMKGLLTRLQGCVELTFRAQYLEAQALQEVVAESPQLARAAASLRARPSSAAYQAKIELGKRVAEELQARRDRDGGWLLHALAPVARDLKVKTPGNELVVLNASFLVPRQGVDKFDAALAEVAEATKGRMALDCVGPLPPYSFVDLRIA